MPEIVLYNKQGKKIEKAIINVEVIDVVLQYKWHLHGGYVFSNQVGLLHRFLMNPSDDMVVDHINHNKLDNRRENLRVCTAHQNSMNQSKRCNNTSGVTGIVWDKLRNKWKAQICINSKTKHLGYYTTKEEAIEARRQAEIEYFGEFTPNNEE